MNKQPVNLEQLIQNIAADVGATEAAAFLVRRDFRDGFWIDVLVHNRPDDAGAEVRAAAVTAFGDMVARCVEQGRDGAFEVEQKDDGRGKQFCVVTLGQRDGEVTGAAAFIVRCSDLDGARAVLARVRRGASGV